MLIEDAKSDESKTMGEKSRVFSWRVTYDAMLWFEWEYWITMHERELVLNAFGPTQHVIIRKRERKQHTNLDKQRATPYLP